MGELSPYLKLYRHHWVMLSLGLLLAIATLAAGIGLLSLSGWFITAAAVAGLSEATRMTFNYLLPAGGVRFLSLSRTAGRWGERVVSHDATFRMLTRLRGWVWQRVQGLSTAELARFRQADLLNRLVADVDALDQIYLRLVTPFFAALAAIGGLFALLAWFNLGLALVLCGILLGLLLLLPWGGYRAGEAAGEALIEQKAHYRLRLVDYLQGQAEFALFNAEPVQRQRLDQAEAGMIEAQRQLARLTAISQAVMALATGLTVTGMLWLAAPGVSGSGASPLTALVMFATLASFEALMPLPGAFLYLSSSIKAATRLNELDRHPSALDFGESAQPAASGAVSVDQVGFRYQGSDEAVLQGLSLELEPGEKLALLGPTGCGKSTLLGLLTRAWPLQQGRILLDGKPLETLDVAALRRSMSVVTQRVHVFSASLRDNLRLAAPEANDGRLREALAAVGLQDLLEGQGLDCWLGASGRSLSGGEQRRLALARALLHDAPLLLLDEPTEGLDPKTERAVMDSLLRHARGRTVIMITHRLVALEHMDRIALMEEGAIRVQGSHDNLLQQDDYYRSLHLG